MNKYYVSSWLLIVVLGTSLSSMEWNYKTEPGEDKKEEDTSHSLPTYPSPASMKRNKSDPVIPPMKRSQLLPYKLQRTQSASVIPAPSPANKLPPKASSEQLHRKKQPIPVTKLSYKERADEKKLNPTESTKKLLETFSLPNVENEMLDQKDYLLLLTIKQLIEKGQADINAKTNLGETPLARHLNTNIARYLIMQGAKVSIKTPGGINLVEQALAQEHYSLILLLLKSGVKLEKDRWKSMLEKSAYNSKFFELILTGILQQRWDEKALKTLEQLMEIMEKVNITAPQKAALIAYISNWSTKKWQGFLYWLFTHPLTIKQQILGITTKHTTITTLVTLDIEKEKEKLENPKDEIDVVTVQKPKSNPRAIISKTIATFIVGQAMLHHAKGK
jgi:hypothetical protein